MTNTATEPINLYDGLLNEYEAATGFIPNLPPFNTLIDKEDVAKDFIIELLQTNYNVDFIFKAYKEDAEYRAKHTFALWLLGLNIKEFNDSANIFGDDKHIHSTFHDFHNLWFFTSAIHDYGYYVNLNINEEDVPHTVEDSKLFKTEGLKYPFCAFNKPFFADFFVYHDIEIQNYYKYSINYHKKHNGCEFADHGILGACDAFNNYVDDWKKKIAYFKGMPIEYGESLASAELTRMVCYLAAQHSIFKSSNIFTDINYFKFKLNRLFHFKKPLIQKENKMLLLLAIADTLELTKKYKEENINILKNVYFKCDNHSIEVNIKDLISFSSDDYHRKMYKKYIKDVLSLKKWTCCKTKYNRRTKTLSIRV